MMKRGANLINSLFLPGYIEASAEGLELYKAVGFYEHSVFQDTPEAQGDINLKRDVRKGGIVGGKPEPSS